MTDSSNTTTTEPKKRGAFIVLEGVDRCGKTTQCSLLLDHLRSQSIDAHPVRFPDRTTQIGQMINGYLQTTKNMDDRAIHLLFSANRWEAAQGISQALANGTTIVCDRYAYSGVAFSAAKVKTTGGGGGGEERLLSMDWCKGPDVGLLAPDVVIFLDLSQDDAEQRGGYGGERYEKRDMQIRVRERFAELQAMDENKGSEGGVPWHIVDASQSINEVHAELGTIVESTMKRVSNSSAEAASPVRKLWEDGEFELPPPVVSSISSGTED